MNERYINAMQMSLLKINQNLELYQDVFPSEASENNVYGFINNDGGWTQSFWTGMNWLAYVVTKDKKYLELGKHHTELFTKRLTERVGMDTHDLGFLYTLSCVADFKITSSEKAKNTALKSADLLIDRFKENGQFIQAWGDINDLSNYRLIIDCFMNLPLLFWASEVSGNDKYYQVAKKHAETATSVVLRADNSTYHTYFFDPVTGKPLHGETAQGYSDDSCWARGQAWAIYGFALCYKYTNDKRYVDKFIRVTDYFIEHLPKDYVSYWDLFFLSGDEERDSSSTAIAICGILEMLSLEPNITGALKYKEYATKLVDSLIENYTTFNIESANGLLMHGVYSKPHHHGVDESVIWGDYFFLEALTRLTNEWDPFW